MSNEMLREALQELHDVFCEDDHSKAGRHRARLALIQTRQALATTEPEPTGMPEFPPLPRCMYQNMQHQRMYIGNVYTADQVKAYGEQCWKSGYKHGAWADKPAANQQLTTEPTVEREAFTTDTKDALVKVIDAARAKGVKGVKG